MNIRPPQLPRIGPLSREQLGVIAALATVLYPLDAEAERVTNASIRLLQARGYTFDEARRWARY